MEYSNLEQYILNPEKLGEESLPGIKKLTEEYPLFQAALMLYLKNLKNIGHPDFQTELNRVAIRVADRKKLFNFLNQDRKNIRNNSPLAGAIQSGDFFTDSREPEGNRMKGADLIDSFIAAQPSIRLKNREVVGGDEDISEGSVLENDEIITETFANILFQQKKYEKAIECFGKLSLKYPEKSIYFAARIEEITKIMNI